MWLCIRIATCVTGAMVLYLGKRVVLMRTPKTTKQWKKYFVATSRLTLNALLTVGCLMFVYQGSTQAQAPPAPAPAPAAAAPCPAGKPPPVNPPCIPAGITPQNNPTKLSCGNNADCGAIVTNYVNPFIRLMTAITGLLIAISLVAAGIAYSMAAGDASKVAAAKQRITNTLLALVAFMFTFGILQWLVPGGII